jgi:peptidoglycan/LPS O-acetylase OafA/YrhL
MEIPVSRESRPETRSLAASFEPGHKSRIIELDFVRGSAALMVFARHAFCGSMLGRTWTGAAHFVDSASRACFTGVDVFFVLSGYIITTLLVSRINREDYFSGFYLRRARRILPAYLIVLMVFSIVTPHSGPFVFFSVLFFSNGAYLFGNFPSYAVLWSLSVEEHFYLFWPFLMHKISRSVLIAGLVVCIVGEPALRMALFSHISSGALELTWLRLDGLALGALLALLIPTNQDAVRAWVKRYCPAPAVIGVLLALSIAIAGSRRNDPWGASVVFSAVSLMTFSCIGYLLAFRGTRWVAWARFRPVVYMGTISYSFYLYHDFVLRAFDGTMRYFHIAALASSTATFPGIVVRAIITLLLSVGISSLSFYLIERPIMAGVWPGKRHAKTAPPYAHTEVRSAYANNNGEYPS